ncbi:MAG: LPS export ABC transporter ATP-binding protein, partial [Gammaproteobacteria bacterium]|nr:LPS export ABC transporter ATP-binding protein [Gammaproteobacteria bacterium]
MTVTGLSKRYRGRNVVEGVGLVVDSGEVVGLLGPNGAGKTTSFYMILGLIKADAGSIRINDEALSLAPMHKRALAGIGYLPQEASVFRKLSVEQNVLAVAQLRRDLGRTAQRELVANLLKDLRLEGIRDNVGERLSGGERRRVEIARALAGEPRFMLLDEPFAGVDPISVDNLKRDIRALSVRDMGVLIT